MFDRWGIFVTQLRVTGGDDSKDRYVADVAVDAAGNVYVIDSLQNYVQKFAPISLSTDGTPPTTEVRNADAKWHNRPVKLTFVATDNAGGSGVDFTEYKVGDGAGHRARPPPCPRRRTIAGMDRSRCATAPSTARATKNGPMW